MGEKLEYVNRRHGTVVQVFTSTALASLVMDPRALAERFGADAADALDLWLDRVDTAPHVTDLIGCCLIGTAMHGEEVAETVTGGLLVVARVLDDESVEILDVRGRS